MQWKLYPQLSVDFPFVGLQLVILELAFCKKISLRCAVLSHFSSVWLFVILWTVGCQVPLSTGLSSQEYWSGLPCFGSFPEPGIELTSLMSLALAGGIFVTSATWEAPSHHVQLFYFYFEEHAKLCKVVLIYTYIVKSMRTETIWWNI